MHYRSLDGLRGVAAYTVAVSHWAVVTKQYAILSLSGQVGVMVFFVLSGFLMGNIYLGKPFTAENVLRFYRHRAGRVMPLYLLVVLLSYFLFRARGDSWPLIPITPDNLMQHLFFISGLNVLWTIAVEVQFYLLFPVVWLAFAKLGKASLLWFAVAISVIAFLQFPMSPAVVQYLPFFLIGVAAAVLNPKSSTGMNMLFVVAMAGYVLSFPDLNWALGLGGKAVWQSPAYMLLVLVIVLSAANSTLAERVLGNAPARFFGKISYSVYLWHLPLLYIALFYSPSWLSGLPLMLAFLCLTTGAATASFMLIEKPAMNFIYGIKKEPRAPPPVAIA
jgi:peptidoglycan/LPS O-acetylase OafA/YrhL